MRELIKEIWSTSKRNKLRTSLTGFTVAWGNLQADIPVGAGQTGTHLTPQLQQSTRFQPTRTREYLRAKLQGLQGTEGRQKHHAQRQGHPHSTAPAST